MKTVWLRLIYALHICMPLSLARWHIERLSLETALELRALFGGGH